MNISKLKDLYNGFVLDQPLGNNAFSFDQRQHRSLYVPPLISGSLDDVRSGDKVVFCEVVDGQERAVSGLESMVYFEHHGKPVFIFDNHNHAFFFWAAAIADGVFPSGLPLVHVDQHKDMREPLVYPESDVLTDLICAHAYTNFDLNVGNFIQPALRLNMFSEVVIIDSRDGFERSLPEKYVLDIDIDIFSDDMNYIDDKMKFDRIREYIQDASFITVATSPFFIPQDRAMNYVQRLFS